MNYLYNGIELPALPEWDEEIYPYAAIVFETNSMDTYVVLPFASKRTAWLTVAGGNGFGMLASKFLYILSDDGLSWVSRASDSGIFVLGNLIWANYDVYYSDTVEDVGGTLCLAASDPIPVGTPFPSDLDPRSWAFGVRVGQAVRRLRGRREVLFSGTVTTVPTEATTEFLYSNRTEGLAPANPMVYRGDTIVVSINGQSYTETIKAQTPVYHYAGNGALFHADIADTGESWAVNFMFGIYLTFHTKEAGTYNLQICRGGDS